MIKQRSYIRLHTAVSYHLPIELVNSWKRISRIGRKRKNQMHQNQTRHVVLSLHKQLLEEKERKKRKKRKKQKKERKAKERTNHYPKRKIK